MSEPHLNLDKLCDQLGDRPLQFKHARLVPDDLYYQDDNFDGQLVTRLVLDESRPEEGLELAQSLPACDLFKPGEKIYDARELMIHCEKPDNLVRKLFAEAKSRLDLLPGPQVFLPGKETLKSVLEEIVIASADDLRICPALVRVKVNAISFTSLTMEAGDLELGQLVDLKELSKLFSDCWETGVHMRGLFY
jgi:hypothetical protein